ALAHPHAIDCSLAMPTTRPRLPSSSFALTTGSMKHPLARACLGLDVALANVSRPRKGDVGARASLTCVNLPPVDLPRERHDFRSNLFRPAYLPLNTTAMLYHRH